MKIVIEKLKSFNTEITPECQRVITNMKNAGDTAKFVAGLDMMTEWCTTFGKTEMGRWAHALNDCDTILEAALDEDASGTFAIDRDDSLEAPVLSVLRFTSLLFENTFSRSIYASMERLIKLLDCKKMWILVQVLRLLMIISKSSRFISQHITQEGRTKLSIKLMAILEAWNGQLATLKINEFCTDSYTVSSTVTIQIRSDVPSFTFNLDKPITKSISEMNAVFSQFSLDDAESAFASFKLRFAYSSKNLNERFYLVMARLIATSVFFYSRSLIAEESRLNSLANDRFIEYCCEILRCETAPKCHTLFDAVKTEALKTLASVVFLEKDKKIQLIVDQLELRTYHGFLPSQIRSCIDSLKAGRVDASGGDCSIAFVTSLFSLVYHIAGFEYGGDALNRSSMTAVLLDVVKNYSLSEQNISFVTRSVRIIDNLTGMDITEFNARSGTDTVIKRLIHEVNESKKHMLNQQSFSSGQLLCNQQRSALMKSLLNFLKRAVVDVHLAGQMRRIMDTDLPMSLVHVVEHPQYYGPSLLHCAITLTTNFIFQEPAQLATLQNKGLTSAILGLIFNEKFPISRDLVCALPNVCSALCLNERGLNELKLFNGKKPLEKMFRIIFSNKFLQSMRKRKIEIIETSHMLGTSFDELIRHHPSLRKDLMGVLAGICDDWLSFEQNCEREGKQCAISWAVGKAVVEDEQAVLLPLGDFSTMMGIMLESMLTNRGVQDNVNVANDFDIPLLMLKLITQAKQLNPIIMQTNYIHMLANILRYTHKVDMDKAFLHLIGQSSVELTNYKQCETAADVNSHQRLCQLTRLCTLLMTLSSLVKSSMHSQGTHEMRQYMLKYFATDSNACAFISALFDAYKMIGTDRLVISCHTAADQQKLTCSQIAEDTAKVRELLINDDSSPTTSAALQICGSTKPSIERPTHTIAMRVLKQIAELIGHMGKAFCTVSLPRVRQRVANVAPPMDQASVRKCAQRVTKFMFNGLKHLLEMDPQNQGNTESGSSSAMSTNGLSASHIQHALSTLRKLLIDDAHNLSLLLPYFYTTGCHHAFFALGDFLQQNVDKLEFNMAIQVWLVITQRLIAVQLQDIMNTSKQNGTNNNNGSQQQQQAKQQSTVVVDGFEPNSYLATFHRDAFTALIAMFNSLVQCVSSSSTAAGITGIKENELFILLERVLFHMKVLVDGVKDLLELSEGKTEHAQEIPVGELDPAKIEQLVEMGFSQSDAVDALMQYSAVHEAAEYIVSMLEHSSTAAALRPPDVAAVAAATTEQADAVQPVATVTTCGQLGRNLDTTVVGPSAVAAPPPTTTVMAAATTVATNLVAAATAAVAADVVVVEHAEDDQHQGGRSFDELKAMKRDDFQGMVDMLCKEVIDTCLRLMHRSRLVVVGLTELVSVFANDPLASSWVDGHLIDNIIAELNRHLEDLLAAKDDGDNNELVEQFASLLMFFCQLWEHFHDRNIYKRVGGDN